MLIAPTLSAEDFKKVHNGKCRLHSLLQSMAGVVNEKLVAELERAIKEIEAGLAAAYAEESRVFDERRATCSNIAQRCGIKHSTWSMYEIADMTAVPYPEAGMLRYDGGWGKAIGISFKPGATWVDLWIAADEAIRKSGDTHHTFIESLTLVDGVVVLSTGS